MTLSVQGVGIPDSKLAREITELVRDTNLNSGHCATAC